MYLGLHRKAAYGLAAGRVGALVADHSILESQTLTRPLSLLTENPLGSSFRLITGSTTSTSTSHTLHRLVILDILSGNSTDTSTLMNVLLALNTPQTTEVLVSLLSPLGNEILVSVSLL